jgi:hypothetical protein
LPPYDKEIPALLESTCEGDDPLASKKLEDVFQPSLLAAAGEPDGLRKLSPWGCMVVENGLTTTSVERLPPTSSSYGVLFVLGESDTLVDPATERKSFDALCAQGMKMQYLECAGATHTKATTWALPEIVDFVNDRLQGKPMPAAGLCQRGAATKCRGTP